MKILLGLSIAATLLATAFTSDDASYRSKILDWRKAQEADLKKPEGWLSVSGLFWLSAGENPVGASDDSKVKLPASVGVAHAGSFVLEDDQVTLEPHPAAGFTEGGKPFKSHVLRADSERVAIEHVSLQLIRRGIRVGVRMYDPDSKAHKDFRGMKWMPVDEKYRIEAKFVPYTDRKVLQITNVLGDVTPVGSPGYVTFALDGQECRLEAQPEGGGLFFNFSDATSGKTTYPVGRFLDAPAPVDGVVTLDFNQATNPPCAWTAYATCPLPPAGNHLTVAIKAGELAHHAHP